jgi:hypothetical protein
MRVLVIGGTLFIGRAIVERLATRGHEITVLHRRDRPDLGPKIQNLPADRSDLTTIARGLRQGRFEAVFDVAYDWEKGTTASQPFSDWLRPDRRHGRHRDGPRSATTEARHLRAVRLDDRARRALAGSQPSLARRHLTNWPTVKQGGAAP